MVWTRERIACDLIGHKQHLIDDALCREAKLYKQWWYSQGFMFHATAIATTIIGTHTHVR